MNSFSAAFRASSIRILIILVFAMLMLALLAAVALPANGLFTDSLTDAGHYGHGDIQLAGGPPDFLPFAFPGSSPPGPPPFAPPDSLPPGPPGSLPSGSPDFGLLGYSWGG